MYARLLPSGAHSYAKTPSGALVKAFGAAPLTGTPNTCGRPPSKAIREMIEASGDQRSCGRGVGRLKMRMDSPSRVGAPPDAATRNSAASCSFLGREGVDTT